MVRGLAKRANIMSSSQLLSFAEKVRELKHKGFHVIDLSLGQPDEPPPQHISDTISKAALEAKSEYESSSGLRELRDAIARRLYLDDGSEVLPEQIIVTCGAKHALMLCILAIIENGTEALLPTPTFPSYRDIIYMAGGQPIYYRHDPDKSWAPSISEIENKITAKTRLIILNYPHNPTGWEPSHDIIRAILDVASQYDIYIISDEPYEKIILDKSTRHYHLTYFSEFSDRCIMINSFSKTYGMVAYRLGYLVSPRHLTEKILKLQRASITNVSPIIQKAGLAALEGPQDYVLDRLLKYRRRAAICASSLHKAGLDFVYPKGGFYFFPSLSGVNLNSAEFATKLLEEEGVAVTPGYVFGEEWDRYIRLALTVSDEELKYALEKINDFIERYRYH
jgi:aspartate/methionine/tyrosine aminotransferase